MCIRDSTHTHTHRELKKTVHTHLKEGADKDTCTNITHLNGVFSHCTFKVIAGHVRESGIGLREVEVSSIGPCQEEIGRVTLCHSFLVNQLQFSSQAGGTRARHNLCSWVLTQQTKGINPFTATKSFEKDGNKSVKLEILHPFLFFLHYNMWKGFYQNG